MIEKERDTEKGCVCERERERERETVINREKQRAGEWKREGWRGGVERGRERV